MDPSAPAGQWTDEKSPMGQAPPPPYNQYPGYMQPGYPPQQPGYPPQQPGPAYPPQYDGAGYGQQPCPVGQPYPGQQGTVTVQPTIYVARGPLLNPVKDYMCYSIFTMLCCCLPLGIAALIYSISAREANSVGDQVAAERSSRTARILNHVALGFGIGIFTLAIVYVIVIVSLVSGQS